MNSDLKTILCMTLLMGGIGLATQSCSDEGDTNTDMMMQAGCPAGCPTADAGCPAGCPTADAGCPAGCPTADAGCPAGCPTADAGVTDSGS